MCILAVEYTCLTSIWHPELDMVHRFGAIFRHSYSNWTYSLILIYVYIGVRFTYSNRIQILIVTWNLWQPRFRQLQDITT